MAGDKPEQRHYRASRGHSSMPAPGLYWCRTLESTWPVRSFETLLTAVYPGWTLQPNFQYIVHPGGGATNPRGSNPGKNLRNAEVGLQAVLKF
jgi:hypothetical protein